MSAKVSVIVPCYWLDQSFIDFTQRCLDGLNKDELEVIVVDDGSPLAWNPPDKTILVVCPNNGGYASAVNIGLEAASGDYLVVCNNDIEFIDPDWLKHLLKPLDEGYAISSIRTSDSDGYLTVDKYEENAKFGSIWAMKRETYEKLGALDESFGRGYYEDQDYWRRARDMGLKVVKNHASLVEHKGKATFNALEDKNWNLVHAMFMYKKKWGDKVDIYETEPGVVVSIDDYDRDDPGFAYAKAGTLMSWEDIKKRWPKYL